MSTEERRRRRRNRTEEIHSRRLRLCNFQIFSKGGLVNWLFCLKWNPCELQERREKGVFRAAHPHTPFLSQCPPVSLVFSIGERVVCSFQLKKQIKNTFNKHFTLLTELVEQGHPIDHTVKQWHYGDVEIWVFMLQLNGCTIQIG